MTRFPKILTVTLSLIACALSAAVMGTTQSQSVPRTRPPRVTLCTRSNARCTLAGFAMAPAGDPERFGEQAVIAYLDGIARQERADADTLAKERAGVVTEVPMPSSSDARTAPAATPTPSGYPPECDNPITSPAVVWRESKCTWDAVNPNGCGGRMCLGYFQEDAGHYYAVSPWNPNVSGSCYGLDWHSQADQIECASRLGPGAWG